MDKARLEALLGGPHTAWILERIRKRLEAGKPLTGWFQLKQPGDEERRAVDALFGRMPSQGKLIRVRLEELEDVLRHAEICDNLQQAANHLLGPVENKRSVREARVEAWLNLYREWYLSLAPQDRPWLEDLWDSGFLKRCFGQPEKARATMAMVLEMIAELPGRGELLPAFAARMTGNSHALDSDQPLGRIMTRYVAFYSGIDLTGSAGSRREAWDGAGICCDPLSAPVLTLNLRAAGDDSVARVLAIHGEEGEPYRLSTRQLQRKPPHFDPSITGQVVYVCENPAVVAAAADAYGPRSKPLVCIEGQPKTAGRLLLRALADSGIELRYHGDFDWPGIRIANLIMTQIKAKPWRMGCEDYCAVHGRIALEGKPEQAAWDAELQEAMEERGTAVYEEQMMDLLLFDLEA